MLPAALTCKDGYQSHGDTQELIMISYMGVHYFILKLTCCVQCIYRL